MLLLILEHFVKDSLCVRAPAGNSVGIAEHRTAMPFVLRINLLEYLRGLRNSAERIIDNAMHVLSTGIIRSLGCKPIQTCISLFKLARYILGSTVIHDCGAGKRILIDRQLAFSQSFVHTPTDLQ